jgi:alkylation response protein AidB-like acyl-CoA dehydrogenase
MDLRDSPGEASFRKELRAWLDCNLPAAWRDTPYAERHLDEETAREWSRKLFEGGFAGLTWPPEYGGAGAPHSFQAILLEESARAGAPAHIGTIGLSMAGPTIIAHGTDEHKARYLPRILAGEEVWCQGFSEPGAGSDLAAVVTRAADAGDHLVVNGQKVWSSFAHIADQCILLARSDPTAPRHRGLTYLLVDMRSPGVEVRPLRQITGEPEFNEIYLTDVAVPRANVLGDIGGGWTVAMTTLLHERGTLGWSLTARLDVALRELLRLASTPRSDGVVPGDDPVTRDRLAQLWIEVQALRYTNLRSLSALERTGIPGPEASISKLVWSETNQRLTKLALEMLGPLAPLDGAGGVGGGYWQQGQLRSRGNTIEAGTSEILRSIIAERVLGLPKSR